MERLPYIDEHEVDVAATPERVWAAVQRRRPRQGFRVAEERVAELLSLRGEHPFSRYRLDFALDPAGGRTRLRAITWAEFPGLKGTVYRSLVIGSGGHRMIVRRMLRRIAADA